jgi:hypothetical protein
VVFLVSEEMAMRGRIGAYALHAKHDTNEVSAPGRAAATASLNARLLAEIDPENQLSEAERERRLRYARKAHYARLALKSAKARRRKSGA